MGLIVHCIESIRFDYVTKSEAHQSESLQVNGTGFGALSARKNISVFWAAHRCAECPFALRCRIRVVSILKRSERTGLTAPAGMRGGVILDLTPTQKTRIRYQLESFCKKVIHSERCDYLRQLQRLSDREMSFSDLPPATLDRLSSMEDANADADVSSFEVLGYQIPIRSDDLAEALLNLGAEGYTILLLAYSLDLSDREIGELLGISRSSVQRIRTVMFEKLKKIMLKE